MPAWAGRHPPTTNPEFPFKKLGSDKRAIALPMFALLFGAMLAFLGLLFDGGRMYFEKRRMQVAADAGARGGALDLRRFGTGSSFIVSGGRDDAALNSFTDGTEGVAVAINNPPSGGNFVGNVDCVEAIVSKSFPTTLMRIASATGYSVSTRAVACVGAETGPNCIVAMYCGNTETGLRFNGNASVTVTNCNVAVNSQNDPSILFNGGGNCSSGGEAIILAGDDPGAVGYSGATTGTLVNNGSNYCIGCDANAADSCDPEAVDDMPYAPDPYCENLRQTNCDQGVPDYPADYPSLCTTTNEDGDSGIPFPDPTPAGDPAAAPPVPPYTGPVFNISGLINGQDTSIPSAEFPDCTDPGVGPATSPTQPVWAPSMAHATPSVPGTTTDSRNAHWTR